MPLASILDWTPDQKSHVDQVGAMLGEQVTRTFACSPVMLGCWACLLNTMPNELRNEALKWDCALLMGVFRDFELHLHDEATDTSDPEFPPGPRILAQMYIDKHEGELV